MTTVTPRRSATAAAGEPLHTYAAIARAAKATPRQVRRGDCQREFAEAAAADGIALGKQSLPWRPRRDICRARRRGGGSRQRQSHSLARRLLAHADRNADRDRRAPTLHVSTPEDAAAISARLSPWLRAWGLTLRFAGDGSETPTGHLRIEKPVALGPAGASGSAYYDALRDFAAPAMGHPPLIRIDAPLNNGRAAYEKHRERLLALVQ
jgi:hypothetical protein